MCLDRFQRRKLRSSRSRCIALGSALLPLLLVHWLRQSLQPLSPQHLRSLMCASEQAAATLQALAAATARVWAR